MADKKPPPSEEDEEQSRRFIEAAEELADAGDLDLTEAERLFDAAARQILPSRGGGKNPQS